MDMLIHLLGWSLLTALLAGMCLILFYIASVFVFYGVISFRFGREGRKLRIIFREGFRHLGKRPPELDFYGLGVWRGPLSWSVKKSISTWPKGSREKGGE